MASVIERDDSREGASKGVTGSFGFNRKFVVTIDEPFDDPVRTLNDHRGGVRLGSAFPRTKKRGDVWVGGDLVCTHFVYGKHLTAHNWEITALYGLPIFFEAARQDWNLEIIGTERGEELSHDLNNHPFGDVQFEPSEDATGYYYKKGDVVVHLAGDPIGNRDHIKRTSKPGHRTVRIGRAIISRVFPDYPENGIISAMSRYEHVNGDFFYVLIPDTASSSRRVNLGPEGTFKFTLVTTRSIAVDVPGARITGRGWLVTLVFDHNPNEWVIRRRQFQEIPGENVRYPIWQRRTDGPDIPFVEEHGIYFQTSFVSLLGGFR